jgi:hypothetical protein
VLQQLQRRQLAVAQAQRQFGGAQQRGIGHRVSWFFARRGPAVS